MPLRENDSVPQRPPRVPYRARPRRRPRPARLVRQKSRRGHVGGGLGGRGDQKTVPPGGAVGSGSSRRCVVNDMVKVSNCVRSTSAGTAWPRRCAAPSWRSSMAGAFGRASAIRFPVRSRSGHDQADVPAVGLQGALQRLARLPVRACGAPRPAPCGSGPTTAASPSTGVQRLDGSDHEAPHIVSAVRASPRSQAWAWSVS